MVQRVTSGPDAAAEDQHALDLVEDDTWTAKYEPGTLRAKRVAKLAEMAGAQTG